LSVDGITGEITWTWTDADPYNWVVLPCGDTDPIDDGLDNFAGSVRSDVSTYGQSVWIVGVDISGVAITPYSNCVNSP
jgi:hypothetical protein